MTKTDILIDVIGAVGEKYADVEVHKAKKRRNGIKWLATSAAAVLLFAAPLPVATAFGVDEAYHLLYFVSPKIAQSFKPINVSCEYNGIKMDVISGEIDGSKASFYISMQGDNLADDIDLYDSYYINCPFDSNGHVSFSSFDEETKTAYFVVTIETMNGEPMPREKVTFKIREMIFDKEKTDCIFDEINLSDVPIDPPTVTDISYNGMALGRGYELEDVDPSDYRYLPQSTTPIAKPAEKISITGIGYIDGALHVQTYYEDVFKNDNHGFLYLIDENGEKYPLSDEPHWLSAGYWADGSNGCPSDGANNNFDEDIYKIDYEDLGKYRLGGEFFTSNGYISGDWEVTFRLK